LRNVAVFSPVITKSLRYLRPKHYIDTIDDNNNFHNEEFKTISLWNAMVPDWNEKGYQNQQNPNQHIPLLRDILRRVLLFIDDYFFPTDLQPFRCETRWSFVRILCFALRL
jgi:hypothetical protein